jgi:hypothetical protein
MIDGFLKQKIFGRSNRIRTTSAFVLFYEKIKLFFLFFAFGKNLKQHNSRLNERLTMDKHKQKEKDNLHRTKTESI